MMKKPGKKWEEVSMKYHDNEDRNEDWNAMGRFYEKMWLKKAIEKCDGRCDENIVLRNRPKRKKKKQNIRLIKRKCEKK